MFNNINTILCYNVYYVFFRCVRPDCPYLHTVPKINTPNIQPEGTYTCSYYYK